MIGLRCWVDMDAERYVDLICQKAATVVVLEFVQELLKKVEIGESIKTALEECIEQLEGNIDYFNNLEQMYETPSQSELLS